LGDWAAAGCVDATSAAMRACILPSWGAAMLRPYTIWAGWALRGVGGDDRYEFGDLAATASRTRVE
jgi:hypothetical protein